MCLGSLSLFFWPAGTDWPMPTLLYSLNLQNQKACVQIALQEGLTHSDFNTMPWDYCLPQAKNMPGASECYQRLTSCTKEHNSKLLNTTANVASESSSGQKLLLNLHGWIEGIWPNNWPHKSGKPSLNPNTKMWAKASKFSKIMTWVC